LAQARAYVSIFPAEKNKESLEIISEHSKQIRFTLGQRLSKQIRIIPDLIFFLDDSLDYIESIDKLLKP